MLVLSRRVGERIQLGDQITITLVKINGNAVRLGIDAPPDMSVVRQELVDRAAEPAPPAETAEEPAAP